MDDRLVPDLSFLDLEANDKASANRRFAAVAAALGRLRTFLPVALRLLDFLEGKDATEIAFARLLRRKQKRSLSMYPLGAEYADVLCPDCRRVMVELECYAPVAGSDSAPMDDALPQPTLRDEGGGFWLMFAVFGYLAGLVTNLFTGGFRRRKVQRLCQTLLPDYPKTLICPACLFVARRK